MPNNLTDIDIAVAKAIGEGAWDLNSCPDCMHGNMWGGELGGCWSPECNIAPLKFSTSPEAAWMLLEYDQGGDKKLSVENGRIFVHKKIDGVWEWESVGIFSPTNICRAFLASQEGK